MILLKQAGLLRSENTTLSKQRAITTEAQLRETARALLAEDAVLRWRWKEWEPRREQRVDAVVELSLDDRQFAFDVEFKLSPTARDTDNLAAQSGRRPRLLIAPHLSETLTTHCRERGLNCLDLNGRVWLRVKGLPVERTAREGPKIRPS